MDGDMDVDSILTNSGTATDNVRQTSIIHLLPASGNITCSIIERLEADLDFYEKISLVFLLYDNVDLALQHLRKESYKTQGSGLGCLPQCDLLSEWARSDMSSYWEEKFLEALCIIKNFRVVERLGYNKDEVLARFLPDNTDTAENVNLLRKALYIFCERLSKHEEIRLIELIENELGQNTTPSYIRNELKCMETFLLYLMSQKHILCQNGLQIITKHLKAMGKSDLCDLIESLSSNHERSNKRGERLSDEDDNISLADSRKAESIVSTTNVSEISTINKCDCYDIIDPKNIGLCVIINQKNFYQGCTLEKPTREFENRVGTDVDRDRLQEAFGNYGFTVQTWENLDHVKMIEVIEHASKELVKPEHSSFVLCILSHGRRGTVYGVDCVPVDIDVINRKIQGKSCPQLINKFKILIIQACQGEETQDAVSTLHQFAGDVDSDGPSSIKPPTCPEIADTLVFKSTIPRHVSYRDRVKGSWFIQSLCKHLLHPTSGVDILDVCLKVNTEVQRFVANGGKAMQPEFRCTMKSRPFLPSFLPARKTVAKLTIKRIVFGELLNEYLAREFQKKQCCPKNV